MMRTYETDQPWVVYTYPLTDADAEANGNRTRIDMLCAICGAEETAEITIPSDAELDAFPAGYKHPSRVAFLAKHEHGLQRTAPETWALPLLNPEAHNDTLDILRDVAEKVKHDAS
jgi:hypothetical protein